VFLFLKQIEKTNFIFTNHSSVHKKLFQKCFVNVSIQDEHKIYFFLKFFYYFRKMRNKKIGRMIFFCRYAWIVFLLPRIRSSANHIHVISL